jgi:multiple sugar transport system permease protein
MFRSKNALITTEKTRRFNWRLQDEIWGFAFIAPQVIGLLAFTAFPVLFSLYLCFAKWDFVKDPEFVGLENFQQVFQEESFWASLSNTFLLALGIIPLTLFISLGLALLTNRRLAGLKFYQAAFFLPMVTASVAIASVWYWLYAPDFGLINAGLSVVGIQGPGWLADPLWAKPAVILMASWQLAGYFYIIFLAGLKHIPNDYQEAAAIDGANRWQQFWHITRPLLSPTTFFVITTMLIGVFNIFGEIYILTRGGPGYSTYTLVMEIYDLAFRYFRMGQAAVVSWVLFIILVVITLIQFKLSKKWVHYAE